ncbi:hypothetical protein LTR91_007974 [Friedmanniomyces endolithicus]|uniref:Uncharacterized protein n=1 Tax=Friedmanniomyces endolithicus TaxID=329885 RepID=A0AAN6KNA1_9PEZI|nr:hypothetical protein LTR57_005036 [Friedmanniomyces endolithicus]KAK0993619.1 hypothetical protein LTR91_007974 [Friedmanniomyces endolithicus]KAK1000843.1 hypothetical protein LTS01_004850 [Friedmanniomyces endolithicus]KAK1049198.1 hypothetical protein LTS16_003900 [Friedmanniomyces endolithicus]
MSAPASLNTRPIPPDRMNLSPASRNTVISGASGRTFMGTRAVRQRVALADTVIPGFTPRMPAIVEEVENPAVELTYPDGDTFGVADADGQVYVKPLHAKRLAVHFCGWARNGSSRTPSTTSPSATPGAGHASETGIERKGLPLCHRRCYNEAIWQLEHPESVEEVTPHMRSLFEHVIEKGRACHFRDHQNERRAVRRREEGWLAGS